MAERLIWSDDFAYGSQGAFEATYPDDFDNTCSPLSRPGIALTAGPPGYASGITDTGHDALNLNQCRLTPANGYFHVRGVWDLSSPFNVSGVVSLLNLGFIESDYGTYDGPFWQLNWKYATAITTFSVAVNDNVSPFGHDSGNLTLAVTQGAANQFDVIGRLGPAGTIAFFLNGVQFYSFTSSGAIEVHGVATWNNPFLEVQGVFSGLRIWDEVASSIAALPPAATPAPLTPCTPQTPVGNGGKGAAGCNTGGVGSTKTYLGASGVAPVHADPVDGELLTGKAQVDLWVEVDVKAYPSGTVTTYRRSLAELGDPSTYFGGRKPAGLLAIGDLDHGLGNEQGGFSAAAADLDFSDSIDRLFRNLLVDQDLEGNEARVYAASPAARKAGLAPRLLFRGIVQRAALNPPITARLTIVDVLFADGGPFGPDRQWPPLIPQFVEVSNTPADTLKVPLSPLYGEKSDIGGTNPVTNVVAEKGLIPAVLLGQATVGGSPTPGAPTQDLAIAAPAMESATNLLPATGATGFTATTYLWLAAVRVSDGAIGTLVNWGIFDPAGVTEPQGTDVFFHARFLNPGVPDPTYHYQAWVSTDPAFHPITNPNAGVIGTAVHDGVTNDFYYRGVVGADDFLSDFSLLVTPNTPIAPNTWDVYFLAHGASYRGIALYGSNLGGGVTGTTPDRMKLDLDAINGSSILWPWNADGTVSAVWPFPTTYVDFTTVDGTSYRLTVFFARGPISDDHKNGVVNFAANLIGREDVGDGTGLPILNAGDAEQHWLENDIAGYYTSGLWATNTTAPKWADGTYKVRSTTFAARQAYTAKSLGGAGLQVSWYADTQRGVLDWVKAWNDATETKLGVNGHGQLTLGYLDETLDPSTWPLIEHVTQIFGPVTSIFGDQRENIVRGSCDWDADASKFRSTPLEFKSAVGYAKYKNRWKANTDGALDSTILGDPAMYAWVLQKRLARLQFGEIPVEIQGPRGFLDTDVDAPGIRLTTIEGRGASGYVAQSMQLRRRKFTLASQLVTYSMADIHDVLIATKYPNGLQQLFVLDDETGSPRPLGSETAVPPTALVLQ